MFQDKPFLAAFRLCCTVPFCLLCLDSLLLGGAGSARTCGGWVPLGVLAVPCAPVSEP